MRRSGRQLRTAVVLVAAALVLSACGGSDSDSAIVPPAPVAAAPAADSADERDGAEDAADIAAGKTDTDADDAGQAEDAEKDDAGQADKADADDADDADSATDSPAEDAAAASGPLTALPDLQVIDVNSGKTANLQTFASSGMPTLLWFWAPHCVFCRAEAPEMIEFAKKYEGKIQVLGLGAQDDFAQAEGFIDDTSTEDITMVWDKSGQSWVHYRVTNQPTVIVLNAEGKNKQTWFRNFDEAGIVKAAEI